MYAPEDKRTINHDSALLPEIASASCVSPRLKAYDFDMRVLLVEDDTRIAHFVAKGLREQSYAVDVISNGVAGTSMTPWKEKLSEEDRRLLAKYLRSLFTEE